MKNLKSILTVFVVFTSLNFYASTLVKNIKGYTVTQDGLLQFDGLHFNDDGKVIQTLNLQAIIKLQQTNSNLTIVDGKGKYMLPGIIDAHGHILTHAESLNSVDLVGSNSLSEAINRVKEFAEQNPEQQWITGRGWNQVFWEGKQFPKSESLDALASGKPIALDRIDGHAMWVNSQTLKLVGINKQSLDPDGGEIIRDSEGNPTGILIDNAMDIVDDAMPKVTAEYEAAIILETLAQLNAEGITSTHDAGISSQTVDAFRLLAERDELTVRVYAMLDVTEPGYAAALTKGPEYSLYDDKLSVRSIKISLDGALGSRGAALDEPYSDRPESKGLLLHSKEETEALTIEAMKQGFQVNSHAIGDRGNRILLDIFSKYPQYQHLRHRIEHAQIVHVEDIPRFKKLNVIPSMQPTHATSDKNMAKDRLGEKRLEGSYAWRKFLNNGSPIASGSDYPVEPSNPFYGLHAAVTRQDRDNQPKGGWRKQDRMTREEALRSFTLDAAYSAHQEKILGSLEAGKWADFILVDQDYFEMEASDIWTIKVLETWLGGQKVYTAN